MTRRVAAHPLLSATSGTVFIACAWLGAAAAWAQAPSPADEPTFTISAVRTFKGSTNERTETSREFELCDTWSRGMFGFGGPRRLYHQRGGLLGLKPGEALLFRERAGKGSGSSENPAGSTPLRVTMVFVPGQGEEVSCPGPEMQSRGPDQADALFRRTDHGAVIEFDCSVAALECEDAFGYLGPCVPDGPGWQNLSRFVLTEDDLRKWGQIDKVIRHSGPDPAEKVGIEGGYETYEARLTVSPGRPDETVVSVEPEPAYATWLPKGNLQKPGAAGNTLKIHIRAYKKGNPLAARLARLSISLPYDSRNRGLCINWPREAPVTDGLKLLRDNNVGPNLRFTDDRHAETSEAVEQMDIVVSALDYGAWGTLRVTAKDLEGRDVTVRVRGKETPDLAIPLDDNGNRIADSWETAKGVKGFPPTWDAADVPGQRNKGDGLSLYEKYRGAVVLDGNRPIWRRLEPKEKVLFVIDDGGIFDTAAWKKASGITAFRLRPDMAKAPGANKEASRAVNTNTTDCRVGTKSALVVHLTKDVKGDDQSGYTFGETSPNDDRPPRSVTACRVYGGSAQMWVLKLGRDLQRAVADKASAEARRFQEAGIAPFLCERALRTLQVPGGATQMTQQLLRWTAIHEAGHACGVPGHLIAPDTEGTVGYRRCYMCYSTNIQDMQYYALQTLFASDSAMPIFSGVFCKKGDKNDFDWRDENGKWHSKKDWPAKWDFACWTHLTVKDGM